MQIYCLCFYPQFGEFTMFFSFFFIFRKWISDKTSKGTSFKCCKGQHVCLPELKEAHPDNWYLRKKNIPCYPKCIFSVSKVCHVTNKNGLYGIFKDSGFQGHDSFLWWNLLVTPDDCVSAKFRSNDNQEHSLSQNQMPLLTMFTTSPAFQKKSPYGNFCFTFDLRYLLSIYSKQHCHYTAPILRVMDTRMFKQEIVYTVLVHPRYMRHYRKYPRLPIEIQSFLCGYSQGKLSWRCQSPSSDLKYTLEAHNKGREVNVRELHPEYFVWDHVEVAFHMKRGWKLPVHHSYLFNKLRECENLKEPKMSVDEAKAEIEKLKKSYFL